MTPTPRRLNITNGDSAAGTLSEAGIEGKIIPWRDVLHEGPVDASLPLEELSEQRARFIAGPGRGELPRIRKDFAERDRVIRRLDNIDEIVLWFEDDLYDQLQLIQLLDYFAGGAAKGRKLSLIVVDGYIPPLTASEIKTLDRKRPRATPEQLAIGSKAWRAFGSSDPRSVLGLLRENTSALPYLARALARQLEEFPSTDNGLSRSEREALTVISEGHNTPVRAFLEVAKKQESIFLGDLVFYSYLERLSGTDKPLITWKDGRPIVAPNSRRVREFVEGEIVLTPLGRDVLAGKQDWQRINGKARWLGGVEIPPGDSGWRWDAGAKDLVFRTGVAARADGPTAARTPDPSPIARPATSGRKTTSARQPRRVATKTVKKTSRTRGKKK